MVNIFRKSLGEGEISRKTRAAAGNRDFRAEIRANYALARNRWSTLSEAESLALSIQSMFSNDYANALSRGDARPMIDPLCLDVAASFSVLPSEESLHALTLLMCALSGVELKDSIDQMFKIVSTIYELISTEQFCARFLQKNKSIHSREFWSDFKTKVLTGFTHFVAAIGLPEYENLERYCSLRQDLIWTIAPWKHPERLREISTGIRYCTNHGAVDLLEIDVILTAAPGIHLIKCSENKNTKCYLLKQVEETTAVIVGEHPFVCDALGFLKRNGHIPKTTDTWEWSTKTLGNFGSWTDYVGLIPDVSWSCAYCGEVAQTKACRRFLQCLYDDGARWGDALLLECPICGRTSIVVVRYMCRMPNGRNLTQDGKCFTVAGGPDVGVLKAELLSGKRERFSVHTKNVENW